MLKPSPFYSDSVYQIVESFRSNNTVIHRTVEEFNSLFSAHFALNDYRIKNGTRILEVISTYNGFGEGNYNYE